ncbi:hypothetical protein NS226_09060 [Aureimonas ureilytica]|uniref:Uncharacterized protein n=1 Tax=Aureimonas ureilytica TaxID=401562 RepID=A0A175RA72_9HYPH|nr:hypothetical protein [Aureimonas ureilytica]KTQ96014.1 hypothetical protein NS226_09060 [Aureimonas ureilytica]
MSKSVLAMMGRKASETLRGRASRQRPAYPPPTGHERADMRDIDSLQHFGAVQRNSFLTKSAGYILHLKRLPRER